MAQVEPGNESHVRQSARVSEVPLISHDQQGCTSCFGCLRQCPARAISIVDGATRILPERCVECGACVTGCSNEGYRVRDDLPLVRELLASRRPVVAVLASEYMAAMHPLSPHEVEQALDAVGFLAVETTVLGEELVAAAYEQVHTRADGMFPRLRSTCPVAVSWVTHFYPQLVDTLVPIVPPYIAQARLVKAIYPDDTAVVYVSPCWARKDEIYDHRFEGVVDIAIGFDELKLLVADRPQALPRFGSRPVQAMRPQAAKQLSLTDGFPRRTVAERDPTSHDLVTVRGLEDIDRLLRGIVRGETAPAVVDMLNCEGCVDGPAIRGEMSVYVKRNIVATDRDQQPPPPIDSRSFLSALPAVDLWRSFDARPALTRIPSAEEIDAVLVSGEFASREETIDCAACGYPTCVDHAAAISLGHSTWDLCFPLQRKIMERDRAELTRNALVDPLTGLGNRRSFDLRLDEEVARAERYGQPLSLAMIDLDRFKDINDQHGHVAGDEVLSAVGILLRDTLRTADIACRYGGDEFAVILPETTKTDAWVVAEKLRSELYSLLVQIRSGEELQVRASLGVAAFSGEHENSLHLLEAADAALYRAKHGGRDRVELAAG